MVLDLDDQTWRSCFALLKLNEIKISRVKPLKNGSEKLGLHLGLYDRKWGGLGLICMNTQIAKAPLYQNLKRSESSRV
jgi:hypothetical protein